MMMDIRKRVDRQAPHVINSIGVTAARLGTLHSRAPASIGLEQRWSFARNGDLRYYSGRQTNPRTSRHAGTEFRTELRESGALDEVPYDHAGIVRARVLAIIDYINRLQMK